MHIDFCERHPCFPVSLPTSILWETKPNTIHASLPHNSRLFTLSFLAIRFLGPHLFLASSPLLWCSDPISSFFAAMLTKNSLQSNFLANLARLQYRGFSSLNFFISSTSAGLRWYFFTCPSFRAGGSGARSGIEGRRPCGSVLEDSWSCVPGFAKGEGIEEGFVPNGKGEGILCMLDALA